MLDVKNITKKYKKGPDVFTALDNISIKIEKGDYLVVNGPSGAGKSTLLYTIGGLVHPDSGSVFYKGNSIYNQNSRYLNLYRKRDVGFMFQQFHLMPYLTVKENISLACNQKSHHAAIENYLEKFSLSELKDKYPSELSVGEKQRTAFIRAIISDTELLLADEPTGNLDPGNSTILMSLIAEFHKKGGTVILVSHNPIAANFSAFTITLEKGKILVP